METHTLPAVLPRVTPRRPSRASAAALFLLGILLAASAFRALRLEVGGLFVHLYLVPTALLFLVSLPRLGEFPRAPLLTSAVFLVIYTVATLPADGAAGETAKVVSSFITMITVALLVRREGDLIMGTLGMALAIAFLSARALLGDVTISGVNPFEGMGNKNAFSLYSLPILLLIGFVFLRVRTSRLVRAILVGCALVMLATTFQSGNRSGWLGVLVIGTMLLTTGRRLRDIIIIALLAGLTYLTMTRFVSTDVLEYRLEQSRAGLSSDSLRQELFVTSMEVGLANPILGVSPQRLPSELARRLSLSFEAVDPHNVVAFFVGGTGFLTTLSFLAVGVTLWRRPRKLEWTRERRDSWALLRMMLVLWIVRGQFSREVLYAPAFFIALGLAIGLCRVRMAARPA
jgi:O-antigen ligase